MAGIEVIVENLKDHPSCPHGPTILFSRIVDGKKRKFYACSACRDRKHCTFFLWEDEKQTFTKRKKEIWEAECKKFLKNINHRKLFLALNEIQNLPQVKRMYCHTCSRFEFEQYKTKHESHNLVENLNDYQLSHPTELLLPLDNAKREAQFLFSKSSIETMVNIMKKLNYKNILCIGTPRIHEFLQTESTDTSSILLDIDDRYHNFFSPLQFCWYNLFNHHFFLHDSENVFKDFLNCGSGNLALIMDPPFGGRVELIAETIKTINKMYKALNKVTDDVPIFLIFPYFMEPQILNSLPKFEMLDYKVDYDNHPLFKDGPSGRKQGSPVRIFTNVCPSLITLPKEEGYKYCKICSKWVSAENKHCKDCNACTSKDGRTYVHCDICERCVKPTWTHCTDCNRCAQVDHKCGDMAFSKECFHCKKTGHKKRECPEINHDDLQNKRKKGLKTKSRKKLKVK